MFGVAVFGAVCNDHCKRTSVCVATMAVCALGVALAGCSDGADIAPAAVQLVPIISPAAVIAPVEIVVPMPIPASLPRVASTPLVERRKGTVKVGKPYSVAGNWYYPAPGTGYDEVGVASWYGPDFQGKSTANGEIYNMNRLSAAHPTLPMPCYVTVTNTENGRSIVVRINDRGPYKSGRIIDLSHRAAQLLGVTRTGTADVRVRYLRMAPLMADERFEEQFLARQPWYHGPQFATSEPRLAAGGGGNNQGPRIRLRPAAGSTIWQPDIAAAQ